MKPIIEDSVLRSDLDCQNFDLRNVGQLYPVPAGLLGINDPSLSNPRVPPLGSVTDFTVNASAAIAQSKLNFNGSPPPGWIGEGSDQMAPADLIEHVANKGVPDGYVPLGSQGTIPPANATAGSGGSLTSVDLALPAELERDSLSGPITLSGSFPVGWRNVPNNSWFGAKGYGLGSELFPSFIIEPIPSEAVLADAGNFTTGVFATDRLPVAEGYNPGAVPDPGGIGFPEDYLGRDMLWHTFQVDVATQPTAPPPEIVLDSWTADKVVVTVRSLLPGSSLFTRINNDPSWKLSKVEHHKKRFPDVHDTLTVHDGDIVWAYAAKAGYNNSPSINWKVKTPLTTLF